MLPLRDTIPRRTFPIVNHLLIAANVLAFAYRWSLGTGVVEFVSRWAFVPARLLHPAKDLAGPLGHTALTALTALFLHGGFLHLAGNLLYLWIFGDNVEDELGHVRYLAFYLAAGVAATLLHAVVDSRSTVPTLGASGAIAGVLGAYFVLFPRARVVTLVPLFVLFPLVEIPAALYLLGWFAMQLWLGSASLVTGPSGAGGVAFWAHVGGFVAGLLLLPVFRPRRRPPPTYRLRRSGRLL